jgi:hypothetical protein
MLGVVMCVLVVVSLSAVAVQQTVGSLSQTAQGRNLVQTVDAADGGIQAELAVLKSLETAAPGTTIPCTDARVTVASAVDPAGVSSYTLSMTPPGVETGAVAANLESCASHSFTVPSGLDPWYVLIQAVGSDAATSRSGEAGRTLQALVQVADSQSDPVSTTTTSTSVPSSSTTSSTTTSTTTTTVPQTGFYDSAASAQALNLDLLNGFTVYQYSNPADSVSNNGFESSAAVSYQGVPSIPGTDTYISASLGSETVEANGSSYACAAALTSGGSLSGGSATTPCTMSGTATAGVSLNISAIPGVNSVLSALVGGLTLNLGGAMSWASDNAGGTAMSSESSVASASLTVTRLLGLGNVTVSLNLPSPLTAETNLLPYIVSAIEGNSLISSLANSISNALSPVLSLTADYQTESGGVLSVSALHVALLKQAGTVDLALSTVGPNTTYTPSTTTTSTTVASTTSTTAASPTTTASTTTSTTVALPPNGLTVDWIKQVA